jgi:hypothetical protein
MQHNTDKEKATVRQKAPRGTTNMKTDTQTAGCPKCGADDCGHTWEYPTFDQACKHPAIQEVLSERDRLKAQAAKLAEELRKLIEITPYSGTISARETLDAYDNER